MTSLQSVKQVAGICLGHAVLAVPPQGIPTYRLRQEEFLLGPSTPVIHNAEVMVLFRFQEDPLLGRLETLNDTLVIDLMQVERALVREDTVGLCLLHGGIHMLDRALLLPSRTLWGRLSGIKIPITSAGGQGRSASGYAASMGPATALLPTGVNKCRESTWPPPHQSVRARATIPYHRPSPLGSTVSYRTLLSSLPPCPQERMPATCVASDLLAPVWPGRDLPQAADAGRHLGTAQA